MSKSKDRVLFNGLWVIPTWPQKVEEAQRLETCLIGGSVYMRIRRGDPDDYPDLPWDVCPDCAVKPGQYHVPECDWERCPACHGQLLSCECGYDYASNDDIPVERSPGE